MKIIIVLAVVTVAVAGEEYYKTGNDNYDMDSLIDNVPLLQSVIDCYKDVGPCSELTSSYKRYIPDAVSTACKKCSPAQKKMLRRFLEIVNQVLPHELILLKEKYDPENKYFDALQEEIYKNTPKQT